MPAPIKLPPEAVRLVEQRIAAGEPVTSEYLEAYASTTGRPVPPSTMPADPVMPFAAGDSMPAKTARPARRRQPRIGRQMAQGAPGRGFLKLQRGPATENLMQDPTAFMLLLQIAWRAWRSSEPNMAGLTTGQAFVGDHESIGLTRQQYRSARVRLEKWGFASFEPNGAIATLSNSAVFALGDERESPKSSHQPNHQGNHQLSLGDLPSPTSDPAVTSTSAQPPANHQSTTNENGRRERTVEPDSLSAPASPSRARERNPLFDTLAEATGSNPTGLTSSAARACGVALAEIQKASPGVTVAEITQRAENYGTHFGDAALTPNALSRHWALCEKGKPAAGVVHTARDYSKPFSP